MSKQDLITVNALIKRASLGFNDHGILSSWIELDYGGAGQGFGGYALGTSDNATGHPLLRANYCGAWVTGVLRAADVDDWSKLPGRAVRVLTDGAYGRVVALGHVIKDDRWFDPDNTYEALRTRANDKAGAGS